MDDFPNMLPCGFALAAEDGTLLTVNAALAKLLEQKPEELQGKLFQTLLSAGARIFYQTHLFPLLRMRGKIEEVYLSLQAKNGTEIPVLVNAARTEQNGISAIAFVLVTIHQRSSYEDALLQAKKSAEAATRAKEEAYTALAQANQGLQVRAEREALLNRIAHALRLQREPQEILQTAVALLAESLQTDRCYFAEYNTARDWARIDTEWHRPGLSSLIGVYRLSDFDLSISEVYGAEGLLVVSDLHAANDSVSAHAAKALMLQGIRALIGVALFENGTPTTALSVAMADTPRIWTNEEIQLVQVVATLTRTFLQEARLHEREHRIAEELQEALLPGLPDTLPGLNLAAYYRPALEEAKIGGDFYDVFPLRDGHYALIVADLSGKGLQAAVQVATVRHMLRALLYQPGVSVAQAITALNDMLTAHELLSGFATLFVGVYHASQRSLTYVNAGQEPGLIWHSLESTVEVLDATGAILGGFPQAVFEEHTITLAPGDVIALFTDGLTEAGQQRKDMLGVTGIARIFHESMENLVSQHPVDCQQITARMMRSVEREATPAGIRDDICLLVAGIL